MRSTQWWFKYSFFALIAVLMLLACLCVTDAEAQQGSWGSRGIPLYIPGQFGTDTLYIGESTLASLFITWRTSGDDLTIFYDGASVQFDEDLQVDSTLTVVMSATVDSLYTGALTTDSAATVTLATNAISWGASTTGDQDGTITFNESDDAWVIMLDDGNDRYDFSKDIRTRNLRASSYLYLVNDRFSIQIVGSDSMLILSATDRSTIIIDPDVTGAGCTELGLTGDNDTTRVIGIFDLASADFHTNSTTYDSTATLGAGTMFILDMAAGQDTLNLTASASHAGRIIIIKTVNANGSHIDGHSTELIDNAQVNDQSQWDALQLFCDGTRWLIF